MPQERVLGDTTVGRESLAKFSLKVGRVPQRKDTEEMSEKAERVQGVANTRLSKTEKRKPSTSSQRDFTQASA